MRRVAGRADNDAPAAIGSPQTLQIGGPVIFVRHPGRSTMAIPWFMRPRHAFEQTVVEDQGLLNRPASTHRRSGPGCGRSGPAAARD